jgi:hypothetical protein
MVNSELLIDFRVFAINKIFNMSRILYLNLISKEKHIDKNTKRCKS